MNKIKLTKEQEEEFMKTNNLKKLSEEEFLEKMLQTLKDLWNDPDNRYFKYQENIEGERIVFITNSKKYVVVDTENHVQV